ncbi:MAG: hypothetical protein B0D85_03625, partial [Candidatus Sedimenticola endophacoides]
MGRDHHGDPLPEVRRIALFTDFGPEGIYIGQMRAVLADAGLPVFDLMNDVPAFDPRAGAYLLAALADSLPAGTLYLCVVDPGVGTGRMPLLVRHRGNWFIGPDNGLLSRLGGTVQRIDWRPERLSESFHGRDLFAPAAVRLCRGRELAVTPLDPQRPVGIGWPASLGEVVYIDHYGNAMCGLRAAGLDDAILLEAGGQRLRYARTFGEVEVGEPFWYRNSIGLVELAVNRGSAAARLG